MASAAASPPPSSTSTAAPPALISKTLLSSARSLVLLQLLSRALTFSLNHALLRFASPEVFGTASIQFDLIGSTLLFLSREGIRGALLRSGRSDDAAPTHGGKADEAKAAASRQARRQQDLNLSLVPLPLFLALAAVLLPLYLRYSPRSTLDQPFFYPSLALHLLAYLLELLSEPYHVRLQSDLHLGVRVQAEGAAVIAKAVGTLAGVWLMRERGALLGFGFGQLAYGLVLLGRFAAAFGGQAGRMWVPRKTAGSSSADGSPHPSYVDPASFSLARAMTQQSVVKHFLTEGDRMIVARVSPLKDQGGYAVATNYGSLVARIVFQPLEETARLYFSKSLQQASSDPATTAGGGKPSTTGDDDGSVGAALTILTTLLRVSSHLLVLLPALGPPFVPLALSVLLPSSRWSAARLQTPLDILRTYTVYLPLMSANGMLEALFAATATPADLARQSRAMVAFSAAFVGCAFLAARTLGRPEQGLVVANCVNAACRIAFAAAHARSWFGARGRAFRASDLWPTVQVGAVGALAAAGARLSAGWNADGLVGLASAAKHVGFGAVLGVVWLLVAWRNERQSLRLARGALREKRE